MVTKQLSDSHMEFFDSHMKENDVYVPPQVTAYAEADIIDNIAELCTTSDQTGCVCGIVMARCASCVYLV